MSCLLYSPIREQTSTTVIWGCYYTTLRKPTPLSPNGTLLPPLIRIKTVPVFDNTTAGSIFIRIKRDRVAVERGEGMGGPCLPCLPFPPLSLLSLLRIPKRSFRFKRSRERGIFDLFVHFFTGIN